MEVDSPNDEMDSENKLKYLQQYVYLNDLIMTSIVKHIPHKDRTNLELTSRRMYNLSIQTPLALAESSNLYLVIEKAVTRKNEIFVIFLEHEIFNTYEMHEGTKILCTKKEFEGILLKISRRLGRGVRRVIIDHTTTACLLKIINNFFPSVVELFCKGFDEESVAYLQSKNQTLCERITYFGYQGYHHRNHNYCFDLFKNLKKICCDLDEMHGYVDVDLARRIQRCPKFEVFFLKNALIPFLPHMLENICEEFEYSFVNAKRAVPFGNLHELLPRNLTKLVISSLNPTISFSNLLRDINAPKLRTLSLGKLLIDDILIIQIHPEKFTSLTELTLLNCKRNSDSTLPIAKFFPKTLQILRLQGHLLLEDLRLIPINCPYLKDLTFDARHRSTFGKEFGNLFYKTVFKLKRLEVIHTTLDLKPDFLVDLHKTDNRIRKICFNIYGINLSGLKEILKNIRLARGHRSYPEVPRNNKEKENLEKCSARTLILYFPSRSRYDDIDFSPMYCKIPGCQHNLIG